MGEEVRQRMVETAAHLTDHAFPRLPVRQWVLSVPKRLGYFMQRDAVVQSPVLRIFQWVITSYIKIQGCTLLRQARQGGQRGGLGAQHAWAQRDRRKAAGRGRGFFGRTQAALRAGQKRGVPRCAVAQVLV